MQVQTTTTINRTMSVTDGGSFKTEISEQKISAFCDCCDSQATGTKSELLRRGWSFWSGSEFCPMCD